MLKRQISKTTLICGMLMITIGSVEKVRAERVITDYEASRLTLSALITPPSVRHTRARHKRVAKRNFKENTNTKNLYVQNVSYHGHVVSPNKRNSHHRRG